MKKTIQTIAVAMLCLFLSRGAYSQTAALKIGDKVPDLTINNMINYKSKSAKLSDFKGKLLILDFWATWCGSCIQSFPKMESLQTEFNDRLQVLMVNSESPEKIKAFLDKRNAKGMTLNLPRVDGDTLLKNMFPHRLLPHYVWIVDGVVKAITGSFQLNGTTISNLLQNKAVLETKADVDLNRPLYLSDAAPMGRMQQYSIFLRGYTEGLGSTTRFRSTEGIEHGWVVTNHTFLWLYRVIGMKLFDAAGEKLYTNRMLIEVSDTSSLHLNAARSKDGEWRKNNLYSYELVVPLQHANNLYSYALEDLNRYGPYLGAIEKRKMKCWLLVKSGNDNLLRTSGQTPSNRSSNGTFTLVNAGMISLTNSLNAENGPGLPVLDRTGYTGNFDMVIKAAWKDLNLLNTELARYGLKLQESVEELNVLVLKDKSN